MDYPSPFNTSGYGGSSSSPSNGASTAGPSNTHRSPHPPLPPPAATAAPCRPERVRFDVFAWYPLHQACQRYFLEEGQHSTEVQMLATFINITLPFQRPATAAQPPSLFPYIRRLVATGWDSDDIMFGWFGDQWEGGVKCHREIERRNFLIAAKSGSWVTVKQYYDGVGDEAVPYLGPIRSVREEEFEGAQGKWSEWLSTMDWMVGDRAPDDEDDMLA